MPAALDVLAGLGFVGFQARHDDKPSGGPISSVAVLPFLNVVGEGELSDLSDGLGAARRSDDAIAEYEKAIAIDGTR